MFQRSQADGRDRRNRRRNQIEQLETRRLLSAAALLPDAAPLALEPDRGNTVASATLQPNYYVPANGYSPAQISEAYGFNEINFGSVAGTGAGETIAIVDAYNDPNISADLKTFDSSFDLPAPPTFTQVNQSGGSNASVPNNAGWDLEISLDVEWAHAIAPGANILLVEANSDQLTDLLTAVNYARNYPTTSVVSMSWGGSEFSTEQQYASYFTTPAGHIGETFVAASGDNGSWYGADWPASSSNVVSVGGTSLLADNSSGAYGTETGWSDSTGGLSWYVSEPSYQDAVQSTGGRASPDVSYDANPNTGFAVYDSVPYEGYSGWQEIGGTSAGAPQWAALIAIANQGRSIDHEPTLNGVTNTLPTLYGLYGAPGTTGYAAYADDFHDVTSGATSYFAAAQPGYDLVTGLGSPNAPLIVDALEGTTPPAPVAPAPTPKKQPTFPHWVMYGYTQPVVVHQFVSVITPSQALIVSPQNNYASLTAGQAIAASSPSITGQQLESSQVNLWTQPIGVFTADVAARTAEAIDATVASVQNVVVGAAHNARRIATGIAGAAAAAAAPVQAALEPHVWMQLAELDASAFADSLRAFAHESAALEARVEGGSWSHTLAVAAAAIMADSVLVGYWYFSRVRRRKPAEAVAE
jgi:subtilase family serine protease